MSLKSTFCASLLLLALSTPTMAGNIGGLRSSSAGNIGGLRTSRVGNIGGLRANTNGNIGGLRNSDGQITRQTTDLTANTDMLFNIRALFSLLLSIY